MNECSLNQKEHIFQRLNDQLVSLDIRLNQSRSRYLDILSSKSTIFGLMVIHYSHTTCRSELHRVRRRLIAQYFIYRNKEAQVCYEDIYDCRREIQYNFNEVRDLFAHLHSKADDDMTIFPRRIRDLNEKLETLEYLLENFDEVLSKIFELVGSFWNM